MTDTPSTLEGVDPQTEARKRRREILWIFVLAVGFLVLTWIEIRLYSLSQTLRFEHSIFFFGLVNFNIILFLFMFFLIFRNLVKVFSEREGGWWGRTLQGKLVGAFLLFSIVPTTLMFFISIFYINNSFDKWFSERVASVLRSSLEVTNAYYGSARKKNFHFANQIATSLRKAPAGKVQSTLESMRDRFSLDAVEYYPSLFGERVVAVSQSESIPLVPPVSLEFLSRGIKDRVEASTTHHFEGGDLVRVIVPSESRGTPGAIVVSAFIPLSLISRMDDVAGVYEEFRGQSPLESPLKSIYTIMLTLMTLVIVLGASWFGFYLAKQLSIPIGELGAATRRVARGDYRLVRMESGSYELNQLIANFNSMTRDLERSQMDLRQANLNLEHTLARLDEHSRYMGVVMANVSTGVISIDQVGLVTMMNSRAEQLLGISSSKAVGLSFAEVLGAQYRTSFKDVLESLQRHKMQSLTKEVHLAKPQGGQIPLQVTVSLLFDESQSDVGKVITFEDLTPVLRAQRAAAWTEVARRIAHEIKNPLTPIKLAAERLRKKFGAQVSDPGFDQSVTMIIDQVDGLKTLVNEFSQFARLPQAEMTLGSLQKTAEEMVELFRVAHRNCRFFFSSDPNLPDFPFDREQMKRVLTNLLDNAVAAVQGLPERDISLRIQYDEQMQLCRLSVSDTGAGISSEVRERIFEPYFTTKVHGTGLGLAIVKRTVEDHNGFVRALANSPRGTRIVIELPVVQKAVGLSEGRPVEV